MNVIPLKPAPVEEVIVSLNKQMLAQMKSTESLFWKIFFRKFSQVICDEKRNGNSQPYHPDVGLQLLFWTAFYTYNGARYRQVQNIRKIFDFGELKKAQG